MPGLPLGPGKYRVRARTRTSSSPRRFVAQSAFGQRLSAIAAGRGEGGIAMGLSASGMTNSLCAAACFAGRESVKNLCDRTFNLTAPGAARHGRGPAT